MTDYCDYPPAACAKPRIGGFINPSIEAIVAQKPDLVLATADGNRPEDVEQLVRLGVAVYVLESHSIDDILRGIEAVGGLTGRREQALALVAELEKRRPVSEPWSRRCRR